MKEEMFALTSRTLLIIVHDAGEFSNCAQAHSHSRYTFVKGVGAFSRVLALQRLRIKYKVVDKSNTEATEMTERCTPFKACH